MMTIVLQLLGKPVSVHSAQYHEKGSKQTGTEDGKERAYFLSYYMTFKTYRVKRNVKINMHTQIRENR